MGHDCRGGHPVLRFFGLLYDVEREAQALTPEDRRRLRQDKSVPIAGALKDWLEGQRARVPDGSAISKAIDYSRRRWPALTRYLANGDIPCDNNWVENQIRPIAIGRSNLLFAGSLRAGKRAAAVMSLVHSARMGGYDPYTYVKDVLERLPAQPASRIDDLRPHLWAPTL